MADGRNLPLSTSPLANDGWDEDLDEEFSDGQDTVAEDSQ